MMTKKMKALTVCQPYAHLIALGEKPIENRTWYTSYRGPLLIHAGKSRSWLDPDDERRYPTMVYGALILWCDLVDCLRVEKLPPSLRNNEHANGPYCLVLEHVRRFKPIPWRGTQGLFDVDPTGLEFEYVD